MTCRLRSRRPISAGEVARVKVTRSARGTSAGPVAVCTVILEVADLPHVAAQLLGQPHPHVDRLAFLVFVGRHRLPADQHAERAGEGAAAEAGRRGALAVHHEPVLRQVVLHLRLDVDDARHGVELALHGRRVLLERRDVFALHRHLQRLLERIGILLDGDDDPRDLLEALARVVDELSQADVALILGHQLDEHARVADGVGVAGADRRIGVLDLLRLGQRLEHLLEPPPGLGDRRARRALELDDELALVHRRHELGFQRGEHAEAPDERGKREGDDGLAVIDRPADQAPCSRRPCARTVR